MGTPATLPLQDIVDVVVQVSPQAPAQPTFNQGLIIGNSGVINSQTTRLIKVSSANDLLNAGFTTNSPEFIAAQIYFSQLVTPRFLWVGAQDPSGLNVVIPTGGSGTGANYVVGDLLTVVQGSAVGGKVLVATIDVNGAVTGVSLVSSGHGYTVGANLVATGGTGAGAHVDISSIGEPALQAAIACRVASPDWYELVVLTASGNDTLALAGWAESAEPTVVYFYTTSDASILNNNPGNLAAQLKALGYLRTLGVYSTAQSGLFPNNIYAAVAIMGVACGLTTGLANSYYTLMFKQLVGISTEPLTETNIVALRLNNINVYANYANSFSLTQPGTMANGSYFDQVVNRDILVSAIQFNVMDAFTSSPVIPQTDPGETRLIQAVNIAADQSVSIGYIAGGIWRGVQILKLKSGNSLPSGYMAQADSFSNQSPANRAARQAMPIYLAIIESGAIQSIVIGVYIQS